MPTNRTSRIRPNVDQTILHFTSLHSTHPNFPPPLSSSITTSLSKSLPPSSPTLNLLPHFYKLLTFLTFYNQPPHTIATPTHSSLSHNNLTIHSFIHSKNPPLSPLLSTSRSNRSLTLTPLPQTNKQTNNYTKSTTSPRQNAVGS